MNFTGLKNLLCAALLLTSGAASASIELSFGPMPVDDFGDHFSIGVMIAGLGGNSAPSLGAYDLDIHFDSGHLAFTGATFGDGIIGNQLDLSNAGGNPAGADETSPGVINLYEVSLDSAEDLNSLQANGFFLAYLNFQVLQAASSQLDITINALGDADGNTLTATANSAPISTVPLPSAIWLVSSALAGLTLNARRKS
ncbi:MAG: cohesin domain-containing protein [Methylomonas sp.]|nr:cohesin domain-containing protein [Methylomonas sp.]